MEIKNALTLLKGIGGVEVYQDDVLICATTENQLKKVLKRVN